MRQVFDIPVDDIRIGKRLRPLDEARVVLIVESMKTMQQLQPIEVSSSGKEWLLVFGWHRLEAAKRLGSKTIEARKLENSDVAAREMREIEENLCRSDLNALDRAFSVERWFHHMGTTRKGGVDEKSVSNQAFANLAKRLPKEVAERIGFSERHIYRDLKLARLLAPFKDELAGHEIVESHADLMRFAKLTAVAEKRKVLTALASGKSFKEAAASLAKKKPIQLRDEHYNAFTAAWGKLKVATKEAFVRTAFKKLGHDAQLAFVQWLIAEFPGVLTTAEKARK